MLRSLKDLERYTVSATDGDIGSVVNFLFDDEAWGVRHLIVDTTGYSNSRRVLISPRSFGRAAWATKHFYLALNRLEISNSPSIDVDKPVSRQHESEYCQYYGYPGYWATHAPAAPPVGNAGGAPFDVHLRSVNEVRGYHIQGSDGPTGHVEDFIVDDQTWEIRYFVIDTSSWWFGKKVLVAPGWARSIDWLNQTVHVDLSRQAIKGCPEWKATEGVNRQYEVAMYDYYGRPVYWPSGLAETSRANESTRMIS